MKKILSIILAAVLAASAVSCAVPASPAASASEDAQYTSYLAERGKLPDSLFIGTDADAKRYGVDMTAFADDGFFTRADSESVVILAKTDEGIDRAVRDYAKHGNAEDYFKTYNEGYRVKSLTVCGNDIAEYAIVRDGTDDTNVTFAASELASYIEKTCGARLTTYTESEYAALAAKPSHRINISVDYPALSDEGFEIRTDENGDLSILGGRFRGCVYGVYSFLEGIGWRFLPGPTWYDENGDMRITEYLYESDHVDITPESNRTEMPAMAGRIPSDFGTLCGAYGASVRNVGHKEDISDKIGANWYSKVSQNGIPAVANHGLQGANVLNRAGLMPYRFDIQPCFTDPEIIEAITDYAVGQVQSRIASGQEVGREFTNIDIAQFDTGSFCTCKECMKVKKEEGSNSGAIVRMANIVAEAVEAEHDGVGVLILAYTGSNVPPQKVRPRDNVFVSYCFYIGNTHYACNRHCIDGSGSDDCYNKEYAEDFNGWLDICARGNVSVWYYPMPAYEICYQPGYFATIYEDMTYLLDSGVQSLFIEIGPENGTLLNGLALYLISDMMWEGKITKERYDALTEEWFDINYGEAGDECYEYFRMNEYAGGRVGCYTVFHGGKAVTFDNDYFAEKFDYMWELFKKAENDADTAFEEKLVGLYEVGMVFMCIGITHTDRYINGTPEMRGVIAERYKWLHEFSLANGVCFVEASLGTGALTTPETLVLEDNPFDTWTPDLNEYSG